MNLPSTSYGNVEVVTLPQELVMANAADARKAIEELVTSGRNKIVLDLKAVSFIDSSGLSVLISALKAVQSKNGTVVLLSLSDEVRSLIELTRLHQVFEIFEDQDAAIRQLS